MREDSNDGKLVLKTNATKGGNLMISQIILTKDQLAYSSFELL